MLKRLKLAALIAVVATAALIPLYGDPRNAPVTHAEWARMMLRGLGMQDAAQRATTAAQAFAILSWKDSLSFRADRYVSGDDIRVQGEGDTRQVVATGEVGEVVYAVAVMRGGDYRLRMQIAGSPDHAASAEVARAGDVKPVEAFTVRPAAAMAWIDAGATHLDPGAYTASVLLPRGAALERLEVAPPCIMPIEPPGGWKAPAVLLSEDAAVTMVQALDKESELPPADVPTEADASQFHTESAVSPASSTTMAAAVTGGTMGSRAVVFVDLPEAGLYTLSAFGLEGMGQSWTADSCLKSVVCADKMPHADVAEWRPVLTGQFAAGHHSFSVVLAPGATVQRVRAERKKNRPSDYVTALRRLGFDVGPAGPMSRNLAVDAMHFLEKASAPMKQALCGDIVLPTVAPAGRAGLEVAQIPGPAQPPLNVGAGQPPLGAGPQVPLGAPGPGPVAGPTPVATPPIPAPSPSVPAASPPPPPAPPTPTPLPPAPDAAVPGRGEPRSADLREPESPVVAARHFSTTQKSPVADGGPSTPRPSMDDTRHRNVPSARAGNSIAGASASRDRRTSSPERSRTVTWYRGAAPVQERRADVPIGT